MQESAPSLWSTLLIASALTILVLAVFLPVVNYEFIDYDVHGQVLTNPHIRGLTAENLTSIFTSRSLTSYYPVRTLSFAIDYQLWGLHPRGFTLTNLLIHVVNVQLVFWLILRLFHHPAGGLRPHRSFWNVCAAGFSAGVFAVHPVVVEPVVWVAGREELLMTLGALGCFHFHLTARRLGGHSGALLQRRAAYTGAALCCAVACLSNAVGAVIPLLVTAWDALTLDTPKFRKIVYGTTMLWMIGIVTIAIKKLGPENELLAGHVGALSVQRMMLTLNVFWLNLRTLFRPTDLAIVYADDLPDSFLDPEVILGGLSVGLAGALLWKLRGRALPLFGLMWFGLALAPSSQIMAHHWIRADRFMYLPLVGMAVAAAMGLRLLIGVRRTRTAAVAVIVAGGAIVLLLGRASACQVETWRNGVSLWEHCVTISPNSEVAHGALADALTKAGQFHRALPHYRMALRIAPDNKETLNNFALELAANDDKGLRDYDLAIELARRGCEVTQWKSQKLRRTLAMALNNFALELESRREFRRAIQSYTEASEADPKYEAPLFNLALLLATCSDEKLRCGPDAVRVAERACEIVQYRDANGLAILATACAEAGQFDEAAEAMQMAVAAARMAGDQALADRLRSQSQLDSDRSARDL